MATLRTFDLTKSYGGRTVVRGVNLDVASGEVVGLLGPNGAGKTTTFYMTVGLTAPDSGRVELDGVDVTDDPMYIRARKGIGYLPQEPSIFRGLTVEQNILAILETMPLDAAARRARLRELLAELNLTPAREGAGLHAVGRRAAPGRNHPRARHLARSSSCSTSRLPASTPSPSPTSRRSSFTCGTAASASSSPTTTSAKRCALLTAPTSSTAGVIFKSGTPDDAGGRRRGHGGFIWGPSSAWTK